MALENLISIEFTAAELATLDTALNSIQAVLAGKVVNLTPAQRQQYGSIAEQNKLFVNKAKQYMEQYPEYVPTFLSKSEFDKDYTARVQLEAPAARLKSLSEQIADTKIMLDHDNYFNALTFYRNIRFMSAENVPGMTTIYTDMKQFFMSSGTSEVADKSSPTPTE